MFKKILTLFKQSIIFGMGTIFERLLAFLMVPLFTNTLSKEAFGIYVLWVSYIVLASPFFLLGHNSAIIRFYAATEDDGERKIIFSTSFWTVLFASILLSFIGLIFLKPLTPLLFDEQVSKEVMWYLLGVLFFDSLNLLGLNLLKAENRAMSFALIAIITGLAVPILTIYFIVHLKMGVNGALLATLGVTIIKFIVLWPIAFRNRIQLKFSIGKFKELTNFGLPFIPTILGASLMVSIDRIFLKSFYGTATAGVYGAGCRIAMVISLLTKAFQFAWEPFIASTYQEKDSPLLYSKIFSYFAFIITVFFLFITLFVEDIVHLKFRQYTFLGEDYFESLPIIPIVMLGSLFYGFYLNFIPGVYVRKKSIFFPIITGIAALINLMLNWLLIPVYGMQGAAWSTVAAYFVMMMGMFILNKRFYPVPYEYGRLLKLSFVTGGILIFYFLMQPVTFLSKCLLFLTTIGLLWLVRFFEKNEIQRFQTLIKDKLWPNSSL
ncbi:oligosaccharide flippase family protein [candidate division KSB1 bacterium]|nr:oligosaccharide flippase family protein [candidate division KSB1 bacterium]